MKVKEKWKSKLRIPVNIRTYKKYQTRITEMKNTITELKNAIERFDRSLDQEEWISELEHKSLVIIQSVVQKLKRMK